MKKIKLIFLFSVCLLLGIFSFLKFFRTVKNEIPALTVEETGLFSKMWETLYFDANFGYTFVGSKPVSIQNWIRDPLSHYPDRFAFFLDGRTKDLWERFSKAHPSEHYALLFREYALPKTIDPEQQLYGEIILINKHQVNHCFEQNQDLFTKYLSFSDFSAETVVTQILQSGNHELIGIILGFNTHNSKYFQHVHSR